MDSLDSQSPQHYACAVDTVTLPTWLAATPTAPLESQRRSRPVRELEQTQFEIAFDHIIERLSEGVFLASAVREYPIELDYGRLLAWIHKDPSARRGTTRRRRSATNSSSPG